MIVITIIIIILFLEKLTQLHTLVKEKTGNGLRCSSVLGDDGGDVGGIADEALDVNVARLAFANLGPLGLRGEKRE